MPTDTPRCPCHSKASEALALLDLLHLFASTASVYNYVRPEFSSVTAILAGRHPLLDRRGAQGAGAVPNDVYITRASRFQVVAGPNMAGKSTYLRSVALLVIMGLLGSLYVHHTFPNHAEKKLTRLHNFVTNFAPVCLPSVSSTPFACLPLPNAFFSIHTTCERLIQHFSYGKTWRSAHQMQF